MQAELNSLLIEYEKQAQNLFGCLASTPLKRSSLSSDNVRSAVDSLVSCDSRLRNGLTSLRDHQEAVMKLNETQRRVDEADALLRGTLKNILDCEEVLVNAVNRAETLLEKSNKLKYDDNNDVYNTHSKFSALDVSNYANFIAPTTSAPAEWRPWRSLLIDGRILPPNPQPQEVGLPSADWKGRTIPSMFNVSWIKPGFGASASSGPPILKSQSNLASVKTSKRPNVEEEIDVQENEKAAKRSKIVGFSDEEEEDGAPIEKVAKRSKVAGFSDEEEEEAPIEEVAKRSKVAGFSNEGEEDEAPIEKVAKRSKVAGFSDEEEEDED